MRLLLAGDIRGLHLKRYIDYFRQRGHTVASLSVETDPQYSVDYPLTAPDVPDLVKYFAVSAEFNKVVRDFKPDVINCHFVPNYGLLGALSKFHPLAVSVWGSDILISAQKSVLHRFKAAKILKAADLVLTDALMLTAACRKISSKIKRAVTVPYGVSEKYLLAGRQRKPKTDVKLKLISTRQLEPLYRVEDFIRAMAALSAKDTYEAGIIGDGSQRGDLQNIASRLSLENSIFYGKVCHEVLMTTLLESDIYVSCSQSDSTSVSLLEAMACGCFPIVSDIPGNREWITDAENGFLFKVSDITELSQKIKIAMDDSAIRQKARVRNFELIAQKAVWENNMAEVESEFAALAGK